ncbi:fibronectin type III domain-containing protein, partial [Salmonella enterica]|uniref:fibronectin type III domain-containing protein n=1 Tax=Salmonella enterica TaxID=28901 RepID=UPI0015CEB2D0
ELAIYDDELTAQEVADHHDVGSTLADITVPSAPTDLTADLAADGRSVELSWTASTDDVGVQGYTIYRDAGWA